MLKFFGKSCSLELVSKLQDRRIDKNLGKSQSRAFDMCVYFMKKGWDDMNKKSTTRRQRKPWMRLQNRIHKKIVEMKKK